MVMAMRTLRTWLLVWLLWSAPGALQAAPPALQRTADFDVPVQPLADALMRLFLQADVEFVVVGDTRGLDSRSPVQGRMALERALALVLDPAQWEVDMGDGGLLRLRRRPPTAPPVPAPQPIPRPVPPPVVDHEGIRVTARRRDEARLDVPLAVHRVDGGRAAGLGMANVAAMLDLIPGVSAVDHGHGFTSVQIRGISSSLGGNENGYYLDDLAFTGVTVPWYPDADGFDLDHVEVLQGPQGTLFGEGSLGGTVRIQTRAPVPGEFDAAAEVGISATRGGTGSHSARMMANLPLGPYSAARVVSTRSSMGGWVDDAATGARSINHQRRQTDRLRLRAEPDPRLRLDLSWWQHRSSSPGGGYGARDDGTSPYHYGTDSSWAVASAGARWQLPRSVVHLTLGRASLVDSAAGDIAADTEYASRIAIDIDQAELRWYSDGSDALGWTAGYYWRGVHRQDNMRLDWQASTGEQHNRAHALFAELDWRLPGTRLAISAGARYFNDHVDSRSRTHDTQAKLDATFATWSPRLALSLRPDPQTQWYLSRARGFRSGQLQPATSLAVAGSLGIDLPHALVPDTVDMVELGLKHGSSHSGNRFEAAIYRSNWRNVPVRIPLSSAQNGLLSARGAHARGAELAWSWRSRMGLDLQQVIGYVDAQYRDRIPGTAVQPGVAVYNVPAWSSTSVVGRDWTLPGGAGLALRGWVQWQGRRKTGLLLGSEGEPLTLAGARLDWEPTPRHQLSLGVDNLLDEDGAVDARNASGVAIRPRPRSYGLQWRVLL